VAVRPFKCLDFIPEFIFDLTFLGESGRRSGSNAAKLAGFLALDSPARALGPGWAPGSKALNRAIVAFWPRSCQRLSSELAKIR
jgi:hypothetical protein